MSHKKNEPKSVKIARTDAARAADAVRSELTAVREALAEEQQQLAEAQALAKTGSWVLDFASGTVYLSEENRRIFGFPNDRQLVSREDIDPYVHPDDREAVHSIFRNAREGHGPYSLDHRLILADGSVKWIHARCAFTYDDDGNAVRAVGTTQDITDRKAAETELHNSYQLLRIASRVTHIGGWAFDFRSSVVSWSDEVCATHGVPPGYRPTLSEALDFYAPESRRAIDAALVECGANGTPFDLELEIINRQGVRLWIRAIGEAETNCTGTVTGLRGALQNINDRKVATQALRDSDERFRLVTQATNDVIWDWDLLNDVCWWSPGLTTQLGYTETEGQLPDFWNGNIHPADRDRVLAGIRSCIESRQLWTDEYRFRKADGNYARVFDRGAVATDEHGRPWRMVGTMVDITQKRLLEAQLEQAHRVSSLGQLAATMAHEFNNVLMGIQPFVEVIRRVTQALPKAQNATSHILESVQRGKRITDEMLRFTRQVDPVLGPVQVSQWLDRFQKSATSLVGEALRIIVVPCDESFVIEGDVEQLDQVLRSLVVNARDASAAGATLVLSARRTEQLTVDGGRQPAIDIKVQDFGLGMDSRTASRVFDPLFTTKKGATGLGLTISHQIVGKHDGSMTVESTLGEGTTFHVVLPASRSIAGAEVSPVDAKRTLPATILIVEDELAVAEGVAMLLAVEGVRSTAISEGGATIAAVERDSPELVLLDIGLPDVSGLDVFSELQNRWPLLPVILMTGHYSKGDLAHALKSPHVGFLQKPFEIEELLDLLNACTAGRGPADTLP